MLYGNVGIAGIAFVSVRKISFCSLEVRTTASAKRIVMLPIFVLISSLHEEGLPHHEWWLFR